MKKWETPVIEKLNINETAYRFFGKYNDGGYVGDGILSGHSTNTKPAETPAPTEEPQEYES